MKNNVKLKDFQKKTVKHIIKQFEKRQRVLLADEVGLGKTIVASEVIREMAKKNRKDVFKVIYVCSNASIAKQNCEKLGIDLNLTSAKKNKYDYLEGRLSMQHLKIAEREIQQKSNKGNSKNVLLLPVTPATSFSMKSSKGTKSERALMYLILKENKEYNKKQIKNLNEVLRDGFDWDSNCKVYEDRIETVKKNNMNYVETINDNINKILKNKLE